MTTPRCQHHQPIDECEECSPPNTRLAAITEASLRARLAAAEKALADERAKYAAASQRVGLATVQALDEALGRLAAAERIANYEREQRQENLDALRAAERSLAAAEAREARLVGAAQGAIAAVVWKDGYCPHCCTLPEHFHSHTPECPIGALKSALTTSGSALAQAIERVVTSRGSTEELCRLVDALRAAWRGASDA